MHTVRRAKYPNAVSDHLECLKISPTEAADSISANSQLSQRAVCGSLGGKDLWVCVHYKDSTDKVQ